MHALLSCPYHFRASADGQLPIIVYYQLNAADALDYGKSLRSSVLCYSQLSMFLENQLTAPRLALVLHLEYFDHCVRNLNSLRDFKTSFHKRDSSMCIAVKILSPKPWKDHFQDEQISSDENLCFFKILKHECKKSLKGKISKAVKFKNNKSMMA